MPFIFSATVAAAESQSSPSRSRTSYVADFIPVEMTIPVTISPGFIATELTKSLDEVQRKRIADRSALKRLADPKDVAAAVAFLMGPDGRNVTGTVMTIDAGGTA